MIFDGGEAEKILEFLKESNAIEGVYDDDSLQQALHAWSYIVLQKKLSPGVILKTHKILMLHQKLQPDQKGYFRKVPVWVGGREGEDWTIVPRLIEEWAEDVMETITASSTFALMRKEKWIQEEHVRYEHIHPFVDGNGRTGRIFMNWERIQIGLPLLIIHAGEEQQEYYKWF
jgi:Fic family protein